MSSIVKWYNGMLSVFSESLRGGPQGAGPQQKLVHLKEAGVSSAWQIAVAQI